MKITKVEAITCVEEIKNPIRAPISIPYASELEHLVFKEYRATLVKVETDEESQEEILATVEDEDVLDAVFERFSQRLEDYFDGSDELTEEEELRREGY